MEYFEKKNRLHDFILDKGKTVIALSGGLDSSVLIAYTRTILRKDKCLAVTAHTPYMMKDELDWAQKICTTLDVHHLIIEEPDIPEIIQNNPTLRCYYCKKFLMEKILKEIKPLGFTHLADGTNQDDSSDYRPGHRALHELGVISPFLSAGFTKKDIRRLGAELNLPLEITQKPAYACLLTRLPHDHPIDRSLLARIDAGEAFIRSLGYKACRIRVENEQARIEVPAPDISALASHHRIKVSEYLKKLNFKSISLDLEGYKQGNMNKIDNIQS